MKEKISKILTVTIVFVVIIFMGYLVYTYMKTPINEETFPVSIVELSGDVTKEWVNYAKENKPTKMIVYVNHSSSSETPQVITDTEKVNEVLDILLNMKAESLADRFNNSSTRIIYYFEDETGKNMSFTFQENLFKTEDGRYYVDTIDYLNSVEGINLYK